MTIKINLQSITSSPYFPLGAAMVEIGCSYKGLDMLLSKVSEKGISCFGGTLSLKQSMAREFTKQLVKCFTAVVISLSVNKILKFCVPLIQLTYAAVSGALIITVISYVKFAYNERKRIEEMLENIIKSTEKYKLSLAKALEMQDSSRKVMGDPLNSNKFYEGICEAKKILEDQEELLMELGTPRVSLSDEDKLKSLEECRQIIVSLHPDITRQHVDALLSIEEKTRIISQLDLMLPSIRIIEENINFNLDQAQRKHSIIGDARNYLTPKAIELAKKIKEKFPDFKIDTESQKAMFGVGLFIKYIESNQELIKDITVIPLLREAYEVRDDVTFAGLIRDPEKKQKEIKSLFEGVNQTIDQILNAITTKYSAIKTLNSSLMPMKVIFDYVAKPSDEEWPKSRQSLVDSLIINYPTADFLDQMRIYSKFKKISEELSKNFPTLVTTDQSNKTDNSTAPVLQPLEIRLDVSSSQPMLPQSDKTDTPLTPESVETTQDVASDQPTAKKDEEPETADLSNLSQLVLEFVRLIDQKGPDDIKVFYDESMKSLINSLMKIREKQDDFVETNKNLYLRQFSEVIIALIDSKVEMKYTFQLRLKGIDERTFEKIKPLIPQFREIKNRLPKAPAKETTNNKTLASVNSFDTKQNPFIQQGKIQIQTALQNQKNQLEIATKNAKERITEIMSIKENFLIQLKDAKDDQKMDIFASITECYMLKTNEFMQLLPLKNDGSFDDYYSVNKEFIDCSEIEWQKKFEKSKKLDPENSQQIQAEGAWIDYARKLCELKKLASSSKDDLDVD